MVIWRISHKPCRILYFLLVFQNCLLLPQCVSLQTLCEAAQCHLQMGKVRPGGAELPKATQQTNSKLCRAPPLQV